MKHASRDIAQRNLKRVYERNVTLNGNKSQSRQSKEPDIKCMTKDKSIEHSKREVLYKEMDRKPMNDEEIALEVLSIQFIILNNRKQIVL